MIQVSKKPSKKIIYLGIAAFLVILVAFVSKYHKNSVLGENGSLLAGAAAAPAEVDSDSDGLSDNQEINVWHTNPNNPDTDGDGTTDGDEINQGRDPLIPNTVASGATPNDLLKPGDGRISTAVKIVIANDNSKNDNLTQNLSKNFLTSYLSAQDQTGTLSSDSQNSVVQNVISNISKPAFAEKFTLGGLTIFDPINKEEIKAYGNSFGLISQGDWNTYFKITNPTYSQSAAYYQKLSVDLSKLKVPRAMADIHLQIVNNYNQMYVSLQDLDTYQNDPLKGMWAVQIFRNNQNIMPTFYIKLANYFKTNGIIFSKDETGSMWNNI